MNVHQFFRLIPNGGRPNVHATELELRPPRAPTTEHWDHGELPLTVGSTITRSTEGGETNTVAQKWSEYALKGAFSRASRGPTITRQVNRPARERDRTMKKRFTEAQIVGFLQEVDAGLADKDLCRKHGFSEASYYLWRSKFGGMSVPEAKRLMELEIENTRRKKLLAESLLETR